MKATKTNRVLSLDSKIIKSGINIFLSKKEVSELITFLKNEVATTTDTYKKLHIKDSLKIGINDTNLSTFGAIQNYLVKKIGFVPYKSNSNRYVHLHIIDFDSDVTKLEMKGFKVGEQVSLVVDNKDTLGYNHNPNNHYIIINFNNGNVILANISISSVDKINMSFDNIYKTELVK